MVCFLIITVLIIFWGYIYSKDLEKQRESIDNWLNYVYFKYHIDKSNLKFKINDFNNKKYFIYTNDKRLFLIDENIKTIRQIYLNTILKIEVNANIKEKNTQQLIALTTTFNTYKQVISYQLKLLTDSETILFKFSPKSDIQDTLERFKLVLEKDIKDVTVKI